MKLLLSFLLTFVSFITFSQTISAYRAKDSIGKDATVCGDVTGVHSTDKITFINMGGKYPDNAFTVVVFKDSTANFSYELSTLNGEDICVTGMIKDDKANLRLLLGMRSK